MQQSILKLLGLSLAAAVIGAAQDRPVFRVDVTSRTIKAINYHHRQGSTIVGMEATALLPGSKGEAKVDSKTGATKVEVNLEKLQPAARFGNGYLTYVLWAITPEGRTENMGELMIDGDRAKVSAATELQTFGMIVTAEPYFAVTQPSDLVVMEGVVKDGATTGTIMPVEARYELMPRNGFAGASNPILSAADAKNIPLDLLEARNAVAIAKSQGGDLTKAEVDLGNAEAFFRSKGDKKKVQTLSRHVSQLAEDARLIAVRQAAAARLANERQVAADRVKSAQNATDAEARRREAAEIEKRAADEQTRMAQAATAQEAANRARVEAQNAELMEARKAAEGMAKASEAEKAALAAQVAASAKAIEAGKVEMAQQTAAAAAQAAAAQQRQEAMAKEAEAAKAAAATQAAAAQQRQEQLMREAEAAKAQAKAADEERVKLRAEILRQLNVILVTKETTRGLIVNMSDVLFDTGKAELRPAAREKLARVSGIILAHPGLKLEVEGHTDSTGGQELNQKLSEARAASVKAYLTGQGIDGSTVTTKGFGPDQPVADNKTADGRRANRRVELVVSGDLVGYSTTTTSIR